MIKKPKKKKPISTLKKTADRLLQEVVRATYQNCLVCGKEISCGHHYFPKSTALHLRYDMQNVIPLCVGCHFSHHNGNPEIHNMINEIKGEDWLTELRYKKKKTVILKRQDFENYIEIFKKIL